MKKILAITTLAGLLGASSLQASTIDIYITGSSAFFGQTYRSVTNLFTGPFSDTSNGSGASPWACSGQMTNISGFGNNTVEVHARSTGSVQGIYGLGNPTFTAVFTNVAGGLTTKSPTICLSDVDSISTAYPLDDTKYKEFHVCVQPFVWCKSPGCPASLTNVTMQMLQAISQNSKSTLSIFTGKSGDSTTNIYLANRNTDSGTRVAAFADIAQAGPSTIYYWSNTVAPWWFASVGLQDNALWGPGYATGGNETAALNNSTAACAIGYVGVSSIPSIKGAGSNGTNALTYNGVPYSSDYASGVGYTSSTLTNSFDNVINGLYTYWAYECLDFPTASLPADQTTVTLGQVQAFSYALAGYTNNAGTDVFIGGKGSINYDITNLVSSKIAISLNDMKVHRSLGSVGGPILKGNQ